ncbi:MAG: molybdopterin guanine dinucleotide synthesis [Paracoccaceae bacterium]
MRAFDTILIVDWSGGNDRGARPKRDAIWSAAIRDGRAEEPLYHRNRTVAGEYLVTFFATEIAAGRRVFAGFDFPFGYPDGFAERVTGSADPLVLWDWFAAHLEDAPAANNRFALAGRLNALFPGTGPFWFNGLKEDVPGLPRKGGERADHGLPERRRCEMRSKGAFTCWQMGGAGAVGSQAMTGMAALSRLRARFPGRVAVWPFEPLDKPVAFVEVWPSLYADEVRDATGPGEIKDAVQVRTLAARVHAMQQRGCLAAALAGVPAGARREEGWILGLALDRAESEAA